MPLALLPVYIQHLFSTFTLIFFQQKKHTKQILFLEGIISLLLIKKKIHSHLSHHLPLNHKEKKKVID